MNIDKEFRKYADVWGATTSNSAESDEPFTLEKMKAALDALGPPLPPMPRVKVSRHATALPDAEPHTDDMRDMVERVGQIRAPACLKIKSCFGDLYVLHPDLFAKFPTPRPMTEGE